MMSLNHRVLTAEQEQALGRRIKNGDRRAMEELMLANRRLVASVVRKLKVRLDEDEKFQSGMIGLWTAVQKFDVDLGYRFSTYANHWIKQAVYREAANTETTVRIPVHAREVQHLIPMAKYELAGRKLEPTAENILAWLKQRRVKNGSQESASLNIGLIRRLLDFNGATVSLDRPIGPEGETTLGDLIAAPEPEQDELERKDRVCELLAALDEQLPLDRMVLQRRFGDEFTLKTVGLMIGVSRERVRQLELRALAAARARNLNPDIRRHSEFPPTLDAEFWRESSATIINLIPKRGIPRDELAGQVARYIWRHAYAELPALRLQHTLCWMHLHDEAHLGEWDPSALGHGERANPLVLPGRDPRLDAPRAPLALDEASDDESPCPALLPPITREERSRSWVPVRNREKEIDVTQSEANAAVEEVDQKRWIARPDARALLGVSMFTLARLARQGGWATMRSGIYLYFSREAVEAAARRNSVPEELPNAQELQPAPADDEARDLLAIANEQVECGDGIFKRRRHDGRHHYYGRYIDAGGTRRNRLLSRDSLDDARTRLRGIKDDVLRLKIEASTKVDANKESFAMPAPEANKPEHDVVDAVPAKTDPLREQLGAILNARKLRALPDGMALDAIAALVGAA